VGRQGAELHKLADLLGTLDAPRSIGVGASQDTVYMAPHDAQAEANTILRFAR
jgi:hypothetical protein